MCLIIAIAIVVMLAVVVFWLEQAQLRPSGVAHIGR